MNFPSSLPAPCRTGSVFFLERKNQRTLPIGSGASREPGTSWAKSFCFFFFRKRRVLPSCDSGQAPPSQQQPLAERPAEAHCGHPGVVARMALRHRSLCSAERASVSGLRQRQIRAGGVLGRVDGAGRADGAGRRCCATHFIPTANVGRCRVTLSVATPNIGHGIDGRLQEVEAGEVAGHWIALQSSDRNRTIPAIDERLVKAGGRPTSCPALILWRSAGRDPPRRQASAAKGKLSRRVTATLPHCFAAPPIWSTPFRGRYVSRTSSFSAGCSRKTDRTRPDSRRPDAPGRMPRHPIARGTPHNAGLRGTPAPHPEFQPFASTAWRDAIHHERQPSSGTRQAPRSIHCKIMFHGQGRLASRTRFELVLPP